MKHNDRPPRYREHNSKSPRGHKLKMKRFKSSAALALKDREDLQIPPAPIHIDEHPDLTVKQREFLAAYSEVGLIRVAAQISNVSVMSHQKWMRESEIYAELFGEAKEYATELLELEARRRAVVGVKRFKFNKGKPILDPRTGEPYYELDYSDALLIAMLKANRPDKYKDRVEQQVTNTVDAQINVQALLAKLPLNLRKELLAHLEGPAQSDD